MNNFNIFPYFEKIEFIKNKLRIFHSPYMNSFDTRIVSLSNMQVDIIGFQSSLNLFYENTLDNKYADLPKRIHSPLNLQETYDLYQKYQVNNFYTSFHFRISSLFTNIFNFLSEETNNLKNFKQIYDKVMKFVFYENFSHLQQPILVLTYIRNSLHNNGMHLNNLALNYQIDQTNFEFKPNSPVMCSSLNHLLLLIPKVIESIDATLSVKIDKWNRYIVEPYAKYLKLNDANYF